VRFHRSSVSFASGDSYARACPRFCIKNKRQRVTRGRTENKGLGTGARKIAARVRLIEFLAAHSIKSIFVSVRVHTVRLPKLMDSKEN